MLKDPPGKHESSRAQEGGGGERNSAEEFGWSGDEDGGFEMEGWL